MCKSINLAENDFGEYLCPTCNEALTCMGGMAHECTNIQCSDDSIFMADPIEDVLTN